MNRKEPELPPLSQGEQDWRQELRALVKALKDEVGCPIHFHTHDTSGINSASISARRTSGMRRSRAASTCACAT